MDDLYNYLDSLELQARLDSAVPVAQGSTPTAIEASKKKSSPHYRYLGQLPR